MKTFAAALSFCIGLAGVAQAECTRDCTLQPIFPTEYAAISALPHHRAEFDMLPRRTEPGHVLNQGLRFDGLWIGERLAGQSLSQRLIDNSLFDAVEGAPELPLRAEPGAPGHSLVVAHHRGLGSNALFPVGGSGAAQTDGRGEGTAVLLFDTAQAMVGMQFHGEYADPLGLRPDPGDILLTFRDALGQVLARAAIPVRQGVMEHAWAFASPVAAVTIETTDPGGIALDGIIWPKPAALF